MAFPSQDSLQFGWNLLFAPELLFPNPAWRIPNLSMYNDYIQFAAEQLTRSNLPDPREAKAHLTNFPLDYESSVRQMQNFLHSGNLPHPDIASLSGHGVQTFNMDEKIKRSSSFSPEAVLRSTESNPPTHTAETSLKRLDSVLSRDVSFRKENSFPETNCRNGDLNPNHPTYPESNGEKPFLKFGVSAILSLNDIPQMERNSPESTTLPNSSQDRSDTSPGLDPRPSLVGQACHMFSQQPHSRYPYYATHGTYMHSTPLPPVLPSWFPGASRGRARRGMLRRAVFSDSQRKALEKKFQQQKYIGKPDRKKLAQKLGLKDSQVKIWFQNRRMKWRNTQERQMMTTAMSSQEKEQSEQSPIVSR